MFPLRLALVLCVLLFALVAAGCVMPAAPAAPGQPAGPAGPASLPTLDLSALLAVDFLRSDELGETRARLYRDGRVVLQQPGQPEAVFYLSADEVAQLDAAFEAADFYRKALQEPQAGDPSSAATRYTITRRGLLLEGTLTTHQGAVPAWAEPLIGLLEGLLLVPKPERAQPSPSATAVTPGDIGSLVVLEFRRTGGFAGLNQQVLLRLDGRYSVSQGGAVTTGQLSPEALAELIKALEAAQLDQRAGDYLPANPCCDRFEYEVVYRNPLGTYRVRTVDGEVPAWLQPVLERLVATFLAPPAPAAEPQPTPTEPPAAQPTAPPQPAATETPAATATPLEALLADLAAAGLSVESTGARVVKPYLSVAGLVVRLNGQALQVFEYSDEVALAADVSGLAPDASSANGLPLAWRGTPHFWRRGPLLVLWVGDDPALLAALNRVLGPQIAGG
ncbi:MAG: hypothetical protein NZ528_16745 [Caldilineales bacterium]|nr:hypothetical protein [Caldilineales bacterium]